MALGAPRSRRRSCGAVSPRRLSRGRDQICGIRRLNPPRVARRHAIGRAEDTIERRDAVEATRERDLVDAALLRGIEQPPRFIQPRRRQGPRERQAGRLEQRMQLPQRDAEFGGDRGRRQRGAMQIAQQDFARGMEMARMQRGTDFILARPQAPAREQR
ncbi:hypothetical protein chiPu_0032833, partial [Chiloscyllium punctatum]|nr:hypothetical protein [Chiloscyllium punctatum]